MGTAHVPGHSLFVSPVAARRPSQSPPQGDNIPWPRPASEGPRCTSHPFSLPSPDRDPAPQAVRLRSSWATFGDRLRCRHVELSAGRIGPVVTHASPRAGPRIPSGTCSPLTSRTSVAVRTGCTQGPALTCPGRWSSEVGAAGSSSESGSCWGPGRMSGVTVCLLRRCDPCRARAWWWPACLPHSILGHRWGLQLVQTQMPPLCPPGEAWAFLPVPPPPL